MKNANYFRGCVALLAISMSVHLCARVAEAKNYHAFNKELDKRRFAIALFYESERSKCTTGDLKDVVHDFNSLSFVPRYREADLHFIQANILKNNLDRLVPAFHVGHLPAYLLFASSVPLRDESGQPIMLSGVNSRATVQHFIENHLGKDLDDRIDEKQQECEQRRRDVMLYGPHFYFGYGYNYPYSYFPWGPYPWGW